MNELWEGTEAKIMDQDIRIHLYFMKNHKQWAINTLNDENWIIFLVINYFVYSFILASNIHSASATDRCCRVYKGTPSEISESGDRNRDRQQKLNGLTARIAECKLLFKV